ncbi:MAG: hypothetical protein KC416_12495, partial [Myxococcales bacterium]|nr:hypothetical protein [Myxococcales bacterium]
MWYLDKDGDGFGAAASGSILSCQTVSGYARAAGDCDDNNVAKKPGGTESCNGGDDDCDGTADESPANMDCPGLTNASSVCLAGQCTVNECNTGFANCDGKSANGCETMLGTTTNCGGCNDRCNLPNANNVCMSGECKVNSCKSGWGDCDMDPENGCEQSLTTVSHCGGCDMPCTVDKGAGYCDTNGQCKVLVCNSGWADCDGSTANGCERNIAGDPDNCGGCGNVSPAEYVCSNANQFSRTCLGGSCLAKFGCQNLWDDCDPISNDGCETYVGDDELNCGGCGRTCPAGQVNNATYLCEGGECLPECVGMNGNCDGSPENGCETDLGTDPNNCGGCSNGPGGMNFNCYEQLQHVESAECNSGSCEVLSCQSDFENCDNDVGMNHIPGCETETRFDPNNCGGCGNDCNTSVQNAFNIGCQESHCTFACQNNFGSCDGNEQNGCETDLRGSSDNCGQCGASCPQGGACSNGQCPPASWVMEVAAGLDFTCALFSGGDLYCWGSDAYGQLGTAGAAANSNTPVHVNPSGSPAYFSSISAGAQHACALAMDGQVYCWGRNDRGQANGTIGNLTVPTAYVGLTAMDNVTSGEYFSCAHRFNGDNEIFCWGDDTYGQIGNGATTGNVLIPYQAMDSGIGDPGVYQVMAGGNFVYARYPFVRWGGNDKGQLKINKTTTQLTTWSTDPEVPEPFHVYPGNRHACEYTSGQLFCWGDNSSGQLGTGTVGGDNDSPNAAINGFDMTFPVHAGNQHTCISKVWENEVICWGANNSGQVGRPPGGNYGNPQYPFFNTAIQGRSWNGMSKGPMAN